MWFGKVGRITLASVGNCSTSQVLSCLRNAFFLPLHDAVRRGASQTTR